jgi:crossover junction endodeoxyribonuclease RusA
MSKAGRKFKTDVSDIVSQSKQSKIGTARIRVSMVLWPPDRRKFDIDNRIKSVLDSLQDAGVFDNDEQIDEINVVRGTRVVPKGCAQILIEEIK